MAKYYSQQSKLKQRMFMFVESDDIAENSRIGNAYITGKPITISAAPDSVAGNIAFQNHFKLPTGVKKPAHERRAAIYGQLDQKARTKLTENASTKLTDDLKALLTLYDPKGKPYLLATIEPALWTPYNLLIGNGDAMGTPQFKAQALKLATKIA